MYQHQVLTHFGEAEDFFLSHGEEYCLLVSNCLKSQLEWTDLEFLRDDILFLATQGWQKIADEENQESNSETPSYIAAINRPTVKFTVPLEAAGILVANIIDEFRDMLLYATQFISLSSISYQAVWWKLFHSPNTSSWTNVLKLAQLIFSLPVSNGKLERVFSIMKNIKLDKRSSMSNQLLDDLLAINVDKVDVHDFKADQSIDQWLRDKTRRPNQQPRKSYKKHKGTPETGTSSDSSMNETETNILDDWIGDMHSDSVAL